MAHALDSEPCCIAFRRNPDAQLRLVCFPHAGGQAALFRTWHRDLPPAVEVHGIQLPGWGSRIGEPPVSDLAAVVAETSAAIALLHDRPLALFGHSLGAVLAFEVARRLCRHGRAPRHLFVAGRRAPQVRGTNPVTHDKSDAEFVARLGELAGTPPEEFHDRELLQLVLPALRAGFKLAETYRYVPGVPLSCPITVIGGADDEESLDDRLDAWQAQTTRRLAKFIVAGDHFFPISNRAALLEILRRELSHSLAGLSGSHRP